ncbi:hypothetical protein BDZ91DRAFT_757889 [Kalaharituber pfeilii]|nr:hypothetical protein BDZ91DRAFT_757889 [Kalaharituber pfeilii]
MTLIMFGLNKKFIPLLLFTFTAVLALPSPHTGGNLVARNVSEALAVAEEFHNDVTKESVVRLEPIDADFQIEAKSEVSDNNKKDEKDSSESIIVVENVPSNDSSSCHTECVQKCEDEEQDECEVDCEAECSTEEDHSYTSTHRPKVPGAEELCKSPKCISTETEELSGTLDQAETLQQLQNQLAVHEDRHDRQRNQGEEVASQTPNTQSVQIPRTPKPDNFGRVGEYLEKRSASPEPKRLPAYYVYNKHVKLAENSPHLFGVKNVEELNELWANNLPYPNAPVKPGSIHKRSAGRVTEKQDEIRNEYGKGEVAQVGYTLDMGNTEEKKAQEQQQLVQQEQQRKQQEKPESQCTRCRGVRERERDKQMKMGDAGFVGGLLKQ